MKGVQRQLEFEQNACLVLFVKLLFGALISFLDVFLNRLLCDGGLDQCLFEDRGIFLFPRFADDVGTDVAEGVFRHLRRSDAPLVAEGIAQRADSDGARFRTHILRRRCVECEPADFVDEDLRPCVRVIFMNFEKPGHRIVISRRKSDGDAGGESDRAGENGEDGCIIFAVSFLQREQKVIHRLFSFGDFLRIEHILIVVPQMIPQRHGFLIGAFKPCRQILCQFPDFCGDFLFRQLQVIGFRDIFRPVGIARRTLPFGGLFHRICFDLPCLRR